MHWGQEGWGSFIELASINVKTIMGRLNYVCILKTTCSTESQSHSKYKTKYLGEKAFWYARLHLETATIV